jgi:hypothetical protein
MYPIFCLAVRIGAKEHEQDGGHDFLYHVSVTSDYDDDKVAFADH